MNMKPMLESDSSFSAETDHLEDPQSAEKPLMKQETSLFPQTKHFNPFIAEGDEYTSSSLTYQRTDMSTKRTTI